MNRNDLIDYKLNKEFIKDRLEEIEERKVLLNKLTATYGLNAGGSSEIQDKVAEGLAKLLDKTSEYEKTIKDMEENLFDVIEMLDKIPTKKYRNILFKKYIKCENIEEIADDMEMDPHYVTTLHGYALKEFDEICKKN